jgi:hypothetical protein
MAAKFSFHHSVEDVPAAQRLAEKHKNAGETQDSVLELYRSPSRRPRKSSHVDLLK